MTKKKTEIPNAALFNKSRYVLRARSVGKGSGPTLKIRFPPYVLFNFSQ